LLVLERLSPSFSTAKNRPFFTDGAMESDPLSQADRMFLSGLFGGCSAKLPPFLKIFAA
jgi:hypothetical protein